MILLDKRLYMFQGTSPYFFLSMCVLKTILSIHKV